MPHAVNIQEAALSLGVLSAHLTCSENMSGKHQSRVHSSWRAKGTSSSKVITRVALMGKGMKGGWYNHPLRDAAVWGRGQGPAEWLREETVLNQLICNLRDPFSECACPNLSSFFSKQNGICYKWLFYWYAQV